MDILNRFARNRRLRRALDDSRDRLYRMALAWSRNPVLATRLTDKVIERELRSGQAQHEPGQLLLQLFGSLSRCWHEHRQLMAPGEPECGFEPAVHPLPVQTHEDTSASTRAAIGRLPVVECQVLTLVNIEQLSYEQTAQVLEMPKSAVIHSLNQARLRLLGMLAPEISQQARCTDCWCSSSPAQCGSARNSDPTAQPRRSSQP
ncbi:hypothetical protein TspCOW1_22070 [Thiohalobacter sp. COW1]|uniref:DNA-directed RNA polymerase n=1 Tax=Thiohalobacter thiocyanaticus TaxID=585455 RepID=A0A1Z4VNY5_9GAMM|nr:MULTISPECIES: sigma factor-like helix-turn-helix DNA-binding protein [Thiohalobacter]BAZ92934.1 DNA-directed RNA polymerase [Thiohalobacter thiocyanaticus]BCO32104.1 hypothetical protein TspCOW1_22070 [Thiohalobacter sp. COW1]